MATNPVTHPLEAAKAYVALVGSVATALLGVFAADTTVGKVLVVVSIVATVVATFRVPNADPDTRDADVVEDAHEEDPIADLLDGDKQLANLLDSRRFADGGHNIDGH